MLDEDGEDGLGGLVHLTSVNIGPPAIDLRGISARKNGRVLAHSGFCFPVPGEGGRKK